MIYYDPDTNIPPRISGVRLITDYRGRAYDGYFVIDLSDERGAPLRSLPEMDAWIRDNIEGEVHSDPLGRPRRYFKNEEDATLCFMMFK